MTNNEAKRKVRGYLTDMLPSDCSDEIDEIMKALEQQPKTSYISIDVKKLTKEVAEKALDEITYEGKTIREWAEVLAKQQPSEDCISREEMLKYQQYLHGKMSNEENHKLWNFIKGLPSVKPQYTDEEIDKAQAVEQAYVDKMVELAVEETKRPKGKWIEIEIDAGEFIYKCSKCGMRVINPYKYCPNCGSYNGGGEDEET